MSLFANPKYDTPLDPPPSALPRQATPMGPQPSGLFAAPPLPQGGVLAEAPRMPMADPREQARMAIVAELLQGGQPSPYRQGIGSILGKAMLAGHVARQQAQVLNAQSQQQAEDRELERQFKQAQIGALQAKENPPVVDKIEPEQYTPESVDRFVAGGGRDYSVLVPKVTPPAALQEYQEAVKGGFQGTFFDYQERLRKAGGTNVSVNTEKNLYGTLAEQQAKLYSGLYDQAQKAPELLQRAQRVQQLLGPESQAMTGAGANFLLDGAKVAAQLGFNTGDAAADTEMLARELGASTLDAIKASGLGAGSGFSNADRDFLEKVAGGKITMEAGTLRRLAKLNERAALGSIERWNSQAGRLDPQQLRMLGMSKIDMPAGTPAPSQRPGLTRNPDGSYNWSP